jgi:hypothetical protein
LAAKSKGCLGMAISFPLTEVFEQLAVNRYLITERFHKILWDEAQLLIKMANETNSANLHALQSQYVDLLNSFNKAMSETFRIEEIK